MYNARTDLAIESREMYLQQESQLTEVPGVKAVEVTCGSDIRVTRVEILDRQGEENLGKPKGKYITVQFPSGDRSSQKFYEDACQACAKELCGLIENDIEGPILVIGLGNRNITADALGPKTVDSVLITRHLLEYMPEEIDSRLRPVCAVAPGVLGLTGVETGEIVKGLTDRVKPGLIIAIDALCSRRMERINSTIQMSDTGITPGAGIGNNRMPINQEALGVPVIAVGVPTVTDAAAIAGDTIDLLTEELMNNAKENQPLYKMLSTLAEEDKYSVIKELLSPLHGDFVVTPKEIDSLVEDISRIIANGINIALHQGITLEDIDRYNR